MQKFIFTLVLLTACGKATPDVGAPAPAEPSKPVYEMKLLSGPPGDARAHCVADLKGEPWKPADTDQELRADMEAGRVNDLSDLYLSGIRGLSNDGLYLHTVERSYGYSDQEGRAGSIWHKSMADSFEYAKLSKGSPKFPVYPCVLGKSLVPDHLPTWDGNIYFLNGSSMSTVKYVKVQKELVNTSPAP